MNWQHEPLSEWGYDPPYYDSAWKLKMDSLLDSSFSLSRDFYKCYVPKKVYEQLPSFCGGPKYLSGAVAIQKDGLTNTIILCNLHYGSTLIRLE